MDANVVNQFLVANAKYFPEEQVPFLKQKLLDASDDKLTLVQCTEFKDPTTILIISILLGGLGIDRFMIVTRESEYLSFSPAAYAVFSQ